MANGIKGFITAVDENGNIIETAKASGAKTKNKPTYEVVEDSGIDIVIKRTLNKDVQYMALILSQGQAYIKKEKSGEIAKLDAQKYKTFWSGLESAEDQFENDGSTVYPYFQKNTAWVDSVIRACSGGRFASLAKYGLIDLPAWVELIAGSGYRYYRSTDAWFGSRYDDIALPKETVQLVRFIVETAVKSGMTLSKAVSAIYDGSSQTDKLSASVVEGFLVVQNIYGRDIARYAVEEYFGNDLLLKFGTEGLCRLLLNQDGQRSYYGRTGELWKKDQFEKIKADIITFEYKTFFEYMFNEALECGHGDDINSWNMLWADALYDQSFIYKKLVDKYPKALPLYHDKIAYRYKLNKKEYDKQAFTKAYEKRLSKFEETYKDWILVAPKTSDDMLDEAQQMSNCIASYVQRVIDGSTNILFLRRKEAPEVSVCTVEFNLKGEMVQFYGRRNCHPTDEQREALIALITKNRKKRELPVYPTVPLASYIKH